MEEDRLKADEYEKQYYGFSSTELYEDFKEQVCKTMQMALKEMETAIKERFDDVIQGQKIFEIYTSYMENAKIPLEKFKDEVRKIFAIPKNVLLEEDACNTEQYSDEELIQLKKEVAELEKELLREQIYLARCKHQKEITEKIMKPLYEKVNCMIKSLKTVTNNAEVKKNNNKVFDFHENCIQYYFNDENTDNTEILNAKFSKETNMFFT